MANCVSKIHSKSVHIILGDPPIRTKRRVAIYTRVSTDHFEQLSSLYSQNDNLLNIIKRYTDWQVVKIYQEEGRSGTAIKHRPEFIKMLADAKSHLFDLIIVKSIARFSRNVVDLIGTVHYLNTLGMEIYFAQEDLFSSDQRTETLMTILSSIAQNESFSLSESIKWGIARKMERGEFTLPYARFLGYKKGINGKPEIVKKEAKIVKHIYHMFLNDIPINRIAHILMRKKIPAPGEKRKILVEQSHSAIIAKEDWDRVQEKLKNKQKS